MDDLDKTIPPRKTSAAGDADDFVTVKNARERLKDGRFKTGDLIMDRYKVLAELGQGGMGVVYRCLDETAGIEVALKALPPELSHNTLEMEDIKDNFQLVAKLVHQNIAISKQLEKDNLNGNYYLIMECCEGEDLRRWIRRKRKEGNLTVEEVLPIVKQVASALDYAHEQKVIHRDIKPGNIMITPAGKIKVLDFGLAAQIHTSMTRVSMAYHGTSGTGPYMAPEQWEGKAQDARADQYALAVMTYEMLAGHLPFENPDAAVLREAVLKSEITPLTDVPKHVNAAIQRAMSKNSAERFESCAEFVAALEGKKVRKAKATSKGKFPKWAAAVIVFAVLAAAGAGYYKFEQYKKEQVQIAEKQRIAEEEERKRAKEAEDRALAAKRQEEALRKAAQARLNEEKLDSENTALKIELREKFETIKQRDYELSDTFGEKIKAMQRAFSMAQEVKLLSTANKNYREAKRLADWILLNGELRKKAANLKESAETEKSQADKYEPQIYANAFYTEAQKAYQAGERQYGEIKFAEAKKSFETALNSYKKAKTQAFDKKLAFLTAEAEKVKAASKWNELKIWAEKISALNKNKGAEFSNFAEKQITLAKVNKELSIARREKSSGNWQKVFDHATAALALDNSNSEAESLKSEAEKNLLPTLKIIATVDGKKVPAKVKFGSQTFDTEGTTLRGWKENRKYKGTLSYQSGETEYNGVIEFTCDWKGPKTLNVALKKVVFTGIVDCNGIKLEMVKIKAGTFMMGSPEGELGHADWEKQHQVTLTQDYWLGKFEVTQAQYEAVMGTNPSYYKGSNRPVEYVTWEDAKKFCEKLNDLYSGKLPAGYRFDLPTEAQWEYACRAGTTTALNNGKNLTYKEGACYNLNEVGWYKGNYGSETHPVGQKKPNDWGLYDMHGNVLEWCRDWSGRYSGDATDPTGPSTGSDRVGRGGCWDSYARSCRSACRHDYGPGECHYFLGFRLALVMTTETDRKTKEELKAVKSKHKAAEGQRITQDGLTFDLNNGIKLEMVKIKAGTFTMGSPENELGRNDNEKQHYESLIQDYWLGKFEVTQAQYEAVMGNNPSRYKSSNHPVENVNKEDAMKFCDKLNALYSGKLPADYRFALPTEREWEYACRAGTTAALNNGKNLTSKESCSNLDEVGWYVKNSVSGDHREVGQKRPNAWGLYDMHGNVWEICADLNFRLEVISGVKIPIPQCIYRGGSWGDAAWSCRSAYRNISTPGVRSSTIGFRLALVK